MNARESYDGRMSVPLAEVQRRIRAEVAAPSRLGHVCLLLASSTMASVCGALLITEPALPLRARVALVLMLGIAVSWIAFAAWVLRARRVLFVQHHILAAQMAVAYSSIFLVGAAVLAPWEVNRTGSRLIVGTGLAMLTVAVARLVQSVRARGALHRRRAELERELRDASPASK
jgi:hypothetical protein